MSNTRTFGPVTKSPPPPCACVVVAPSHRPTAIIRTTGNEYHVGETGRPAGCKCHHKLKLNEMETRHRRRNHEARRRGGGVAIKNSSCFVGRPALVKYLGVRSARCEVRMTSKQKAGRPGLHNRPYTYCSLKPSFRPTSKRRTERTNSRLYIEKSKHSRAGLAGRCPFPSSCCMAISCLLKMAREREEGWLILLPAIIYNSSTVSSLQSYYWQPEGLRLIVREASRGEALGHWGGNSHAFGIGFSPTPTTRNYHHHPTLLTQST